MNTNVANSTEASATVVRPKLANIAGTVLSVVARPRTSKTGEKVDLMATLEIKGKTKTFKKNVRVFDGAPKAALESVLIVGKYVNLFGVYESFTGSDGKPAQSFKAIGVSARRKAVAEIAA